MILVQAFFSFAISLLSLNSSSASSNFDDAGNVPSNRVNLPQGSRTAINRPPPVTIRHRGNRVVTAGQIYPKNNITKHALSTKIVKKAHRNVQLRAHRSYTNRGLGKVTQDPIVN